MSILTRMFPGAILVMFALPVFALGPEPGPGPENPLSSPHEGQPAETSDTVLSQSDIRRLDHYSAQALAALQSFETGTDSEALVASLRQKVRRLVDAGQRSGMSLVATADFFKAYLAENTSAPLPGAMLDANGQFNARGLFASTMIYFETRAKAEVDIAAIEDADLAAINSVAQRLTPEAPTPPPVQLSVIEPPEAVVVQGPAIPEGVSDNARAILERVRVKGEAWVITVKPGDSLGQFANALYGDTLLFNRIYQANLGILRTPNTITVGQELVLPKG